MERIDIRHKNVQITKVLLAKSIIEISKKKPIRAITISEITNNCGLCRETFYKHFIDKYDLIDWIYDFHINRIFEGFNSNESEDAALTCTREWLTFLKDNYAFVSNTFRDNHQNSFNDSLLKFALKITKQQMKYDKKNKMQEDILFYIRFYTYGQVKIIEEWFRDGMKESPEHLSKLIINAISSTANSLSA